MEDGWIGILLFWIAVVDASDFVFKLLNKDDKLFIGLIKSVVSLVIDGVEKSNNEVVVVVELVVEIPQSSSSTGIDGFGGRIGMIGGGGGCSDGGVELSSILYGISLNSSLIHIQLL